MEMSPQWEYLTLLVSVQFKVFGETEGHPKSINGQEIKGWKKIDLNTFLSQLGVDHWEMTGTISAMYPPREIATVTAHYLFFKRIKP
jgi:hypothetical protein